MSRLIKLGISSDYPVKWSFEKVLRDLIQNYYDSLGEKQFSSGFNYAWRVQADNTISLSMKSENRPFDFHWLVYIGGSTKTGKPGYIGKYGEGFKVCMLSLLSMEITDITMHSGDWKIRPCIYQEMIDGQPVNMLGYQMENTEDDHVTLLTINGIPRKEERYIREGLMHFFFPRNPLFGERMAETEIYQIYSSNGKPIPCQQPAGLKGILYLNYLAAGRLSAPFYINLNDPFEERSRERSLLRPEDTMRLLYTASILMKPEDSLRLLMLLENYWDEIPKRTFDFRTWYYIICQLVRNISVSERTSVAFRRKYADLAYIERPGNNRKKNTLIERVKIWSRDNDNRRQTNPIFRLLGAENLLERYQIEGKKNLRAANAKEIMLMTVLITGIESVLPETLQFPDVRIRNKKRGEDILLQEKKGRSVMQIVLWIGSESRSEQDPLAEASLLTPAEGCRKNGLRQRYLLHDLIMSERDFRSDSFDKAFIKSADKLLHIYGSSRSECLNDIFTDFGGWMLKHQEQIYRCREEWLKYSA